MLPRIADEVDPEMDPSHFSPSGAVAPIDAADAMTAAVMIVDVPSVGIAATTEATPASTVSAILMSSGSQSVAWSNAVIVAFTIPLTLSRVPWTNALWPSTALRRATIDMNWLAQWYGSLS